MTKNNAIHTINEDLKVKVIIEEYKNIKEQIKVFNDKIIDNDDVFMKNYYQFTFKEDNIFKECSIVIYANCFEAAKKFMNMFFNDIWIYNKENKTIQYDSINNKIYSTIKYTLDCICI